ncbi:FG-GAP-like repeat-containing protein [Steroidobacter flavus]|uniref:FG-GAP-like repeat-containing protein n=1 Tax=Steroidobacter flavus TaxID=1842136 RepID=A0ABV8SY36_9GAMM
MISSRARSPFVLLILFLSLASAAFAQTLPVTSTGMTGGSFDVSATGQATYSIPIWSPPGTRGIEPRLALNYSSHAGGGLIGPGWSLSGLSHITRCTRTHEQDGFARAVFLDSSDVFCIDGRRLRLTSGIYGTAGSTYQTEIADFSLTTARDTAGNGPAWFEVKTKEGLILEYGGTSNSRAVLASGTTPYIWAISKIRDRQGNNLVIDYQLESGTLRPTLIQYTQSPAIGATYPYAVQFNYQTRDANDVMVGYVAGGQYLVGSQLTSIDVKAGGVGGTLLRRYRLSYTDSPTTQRSRLASVQECAGTGGTDCLSPTTINYQNGQIGIAAPSISAGSVPAGVARQVADVNGDGRSDIINDITSGSTRTYSVSFASSSGYLAAVSTGISAPLSEVTLLDDFLGNGTLQFLAQSGGYWYLYQWNGSSFSATSAQLQVDPNRVTGTAPGEVNAPNFASADVDGDGLPDLVWAATYNNVRSVYTRLNTSAGGVPSFSTTMTNAYPVPTYFSGLLGNNKFFVAPRLDFNGDQRDDVIMISANTGGQLVTFTSRELISQGTTFATGSDLSGHFSAANALNWNNDACTDLQLNGWISISACNGAIAQQIVLSQGGMAGLDWDGDNRTDIVSTEFNGSIAVRLSQGTSLSAPLPSGLPNGTSISALDYDGDGLHDLMSINSAGAVTIGLHNGAGTPPDLVSSIVDGYGMAFSPTYKTITQSNYGAIYPNAPAIAFPDVKYTHPFYVVDQFSASDGTGGTYTNQFFYWSARKHVRGRGFKGFAARRTLDSRTGMYRYEEYRQDFPYIGRVSADRLLQPNNTTVAESTVNTLQSAPLATTAFNQRYFVYLYQASTNTYEVGGAYNGAQTINTLETNTYDSWGSLLDRVVTTTEIGTGLNTGVVHTSRTYAPSVVNDTANWCLSRPNQVQQINSHSSTGGGAITQTTGYTWDTVNCRLQQEVTEPGSTQWQVTGVYGYDSVGNVNSLTVTPAAGQGQAARTFGVNYGSTGQFPTTITNAKSQVTTFGWDLVRGIRTSITDPNGRVTSLTPDNFNRIVREQRPDGTATDFHMYACSGITTYCGSSDVRTYLEVVVRDTNNAAIRTDVASFDGYGRQRYTYEQLLTGGMSSRISIYNSRGLLQAISMPFIQGSPIWYATLSYDLLGRATSLSRPTSESNPSTYLTQLAYNGLSIVATDPLNRTQTRWVNALGSPVRTVDAAGNDTNYEYDGFGNLLKTRDFYGNETVLTYSNRGFKLTSNDPDMGLWSYSYYPLGELRSKTDAKGQVASFTYDALSRMLTRVEPEGTTTFTYDTQANGIGQPASIVAPGGYQETFSYDNRGRIQNHNTTIDGTTYSYVYGYSALTGLLDSLTYPASYGTPFKAQYDYNYGQLARVKDFAAPTTVFWEALAVDAHSRPIHHQLGNGLSVLRTFDRITGLIDRIDSGFSGSNDRQQLQYTWSPTGNLMSRADLNQGTLNESFTYDALDRLDTVQRNGVQTLNVDYDAIGNITFKSDVGSYAYHATKKHAVTMAGSNTYAYDANGNVTSRNGLTANWYSYNLPAQINGAGGKYARFWYGPTRQRYKQEHHQYEPAEASPRVTLYVGGLFEKVTQSYGGPNDYETVYRHYIFAGGERVASVVRITSAEDGQVSQSHWTAYYAPDHLGSADSEFLQVDGFPPVQNPFARYSNSVFGERRDIDWDGPALDANAPWFNSSNRGFTDHEHLDNLDGLIHMNGRVYDSRVGRFMSADPFVQFPFAGQGLNRYSYALNNPLRYIDPSGFGLFDFFDDLFDGIGSVFSSLGNWLGSAVGWVQWARDFYREGGSGGLRCASNCNRGGSTEANPPPVPRVRPDPPGTTPSPAPPPPRVRPAPDPTLPPADGSLGGVGNSAADTPTGGKGDGKGATQVTPTPACEGAMVTVIGDGVIIPVFTPGLCQSTADAINKGTRDGVLIGSAVVGTYVLPSLGRVVAGQLLRRTVGNQQMTRQERLQEVYRRLETQRATTAEEAQAQLNKTLEAVEDQFSGVPKNPNPGLKPDGRMYVPQADNIKRLADGTIRATTRGNIVEYGPDGSITIIDRATLQIVFQRAGGL